MLTKKDRSNLTFNQKKQMFHIDQTINPDTGRKIEIGKDTYNKLALLYEYTYQPPNYDIIPKDVLPQIFDNIPLSTARLLNRQTLKETEKRITKKDYILLSDKGRTPKLAKGDIVLYDDGINQLLAAVYNVTSSTKAQIIALTDDNPFFKNKIVNTYRKYMTIVKLSPSYFDTLPMKAKLRIATLLDDIYLGQINAY